MALSPVPAVACRAPPSRRPASRVVCAVRRVPRPRVPAIRAPRAAVNRTPDHGVRVAGGGWHGTESANADSAGTASRRAIALEASSSGHNAAGATDTCGTTTARDADDWHLRECAPYSHTNIVSNGKREEQVKTVQVHMAGCTSLFGKANNLLRYV